MVNLQTYPKLFFELQLIFAQKVAEMCYQPLRDVLLRFTALYRILGLDWSFNPTHTVWQSYLQRLQQESISTDWTYQFYLRRYIEGNYRSN